jgi:hypothetical protein
MLIYNVAASLALLEGDVKPSSRLVLLDNEVDVLLIKPMKIIYTSMPIAR